MICVTLAAIVDTAALGKVIVASFIAVIIATVAFSLAILGATRFADMRQSDRPLGAVLFGTLAVLSVSTVLGMVVYGIVIMASK